MSNQSTADNITIPISDLLKILLGTQESGISCAKVPMTTAIILAEKIKNNGLYKLEFYDNDGNELDEPVIWWRRDWDLSHLSWEKAKKYSDARRLENWLLNANVSLLAKAIQKKTPIPDKEANIMALSMVRNPNAIVVITQFFGVAKLKSTLEELE